MSGIQRLKMASRVKMGLKGAGQVVKGTAIRATAFGSHDVNTQVLRNTYNKKLKRKFLRAKMKKHRGQSKKAQGFINIDKAIKGYWGA